MRTDTSARRRALALAVLLALIGSSVALAQSFRISQTLQAAGDVVSGSVQISPDGARAIYRADSTSDETFDLFSAPLAGGAATRLSSASITTGFSTIMVSPDSTRVLYLADQDTDTVFELYSVPIGGPSTAAVKLNPELVAGGDVSEFEITPDGQSVLYRADQEVDGRTELYRVPIAGPSSSAAKLSIPIGGTSTVSRLALSPNGQRALYTVSSCDGAICGVLIELYSVPVAGPASSSIKLKEQLGGRAFANFLMVVSPDSARVAYVDDQETEGLFELYSVPIDGPLSATVKLNSTPVAGAEVIDQASSVVFTADSARVVYRMLTGGSAAELFSVPAAGPSSSAVKLSKTLVTGGTVSSFALTPDGATAVYLADQDTDTVGELYRVPVAGPASAGAKVTPAQVAGGIGVVSYAISGEGDRVVYRAEQSSALAIELYSVPLAGPSSSSVKLNKALASGGNVLEVLVASDGSQVVYLADQDADAVVELYSVPLGGPASAGVKISGALVTGGGVASALLAPDGGRALYRADEDTDNKFELYIADAGPPAVAFAASAREVGELDGVVQLEVRLARSSVAPSSVQYRVSGGSATSGSDFTLAAGTLSFLAGQRSASIPLTLRGDLVAEGLETLTVVIESPSNASLGAPASMTISIRDGGAALPLVVR